MYKQRCVDGIGDYYWCSNIIYQMYCIFIRLGDCKDDQYLYYFSDECDGIGGNGVKDFISAFAVDQDVVYQVIE